MEHKALYFLLFILSIVDAKSQSRYKITSGSINFTSNAELEVIKASSDQVTGLIDSSNNHYAFKVLISSFKGFNSNLQREHFNDKYMESERFAEANFSGKIIEQIPFGQDGTYEVRAKGDLEIHGVKQNRIIKASVVVKNGTLSIVSNFNIPLSDHNITIPSIVNQKIATEIRVEFKALMKIQP